MHRPLHALLLSATLFASVASHAADIVLTDLPIATTTASNCYLGCGNDRYDHSNILDDDVGATGNTGLNSWNSGFYGGWVQVDFGGTYVLDRVELYGNYGYYNPFTLLASTDGTAFGTIATGGYNVTPSLSRSDVSGGVKYGAVFDVANATLAPNTLARYLRYSVTSGSPHWGYLFEIVATGHLPATPPVDPPDGGTDTPVPVPGTEALLLVGLASLGLLRRRASEARTGVAARTA